MQVENLDIAEDTQVKVGFTHQPAFWFTLIAVVGLTLVVVIWPKYQQRRAHLDRQFEARNISYEYRVQQSREFLKNNPQPRSTAWTWPVVLAFMALLIPILALIMSTLTRPHHSTQIHSLKKTEEPPRDPLA